MEEAVVAEDPKSEAMGNCMPLNKHGSPAAKEEMLGYLPFLRFRIFRHLFRCRAPVRLVRLHVYRSSLTRTLQQIFH